MDDEPADDMQPEEKDVKDLPEEPDKPESEEIVEEKPKKTNSKHSTADYKNYDVKPKLPHPIWGKLSKVIGILIILALLAGGTYWFLKHHKSTAKPAKTASSDQSTSATAPTTALTKIDTTFKHYDSTHFGLGLDYPANWTVDDTAGSTSMTITSPQTQLVGADGQKTKVKIILSIRAKTQKLNEFNYRSGQAALASTKITYTEPTDTQRGSTYETFLRFGSTTNKNGFDGIYITGNNGYQAGQAIPVTDFAQVEPVVSITFLNASGGNQTIATSNWDNSDFSTPLNKMLESLAIN